MILQDFEYEKPESLEAAAALLAENGESARLMAGGTDLLPNMRIELEMPDVVVSLSGIAPTDPLENGDGSITVDALIPLAELTADPTVRRTHPLMAESAHTVAGNQIREMGTLGGNLCQEVRCLYLNQNHDFQFVEPCYKRGGDCCYPFPRNDKTTCWAVYMSDVAAALIALDASLDVLEPDGTRQIPVNDFFTGDALSPNSLGPAEIIKSVTLPATPPRFGWGYHKTGLRGGLEFGMAVIAATLQMSADGKTCEGANIVFSAVGQSPLSPVETAQAMSGAELTAEALADFAKRAAKEIDPLPHHGFTIRYLRDNIEVHLRRVLARAVERATGE